MEDESIYMILDFDEDTERVSLHTFKLDKDEAYKVAKARKAFVSELKYVDPYLEEKPNE